MESKVIIVLAFLVIIGAWLIVRTAVRNTVRTRNDRQEEILEELAKIRKLLEKDGKPE